MRPTPLRVALLLLALASSPLIFTTLTFTGEDWSAIRHGAELALEGASPFLEPKYRWSPVAAWLTIPLLAVPTWAWLAMHVVALALLRDRWAFLIGVVSWPFWQDTGVGNVITFVVVVAWWALRGSRAAAIGYLALVILMPRPLMLPVAAWLVWNQPAVRLPMVVMLLVHGVAVYLSGHAFEWVGVLVHAGSVDMANPYAIGPSRVIGAAWLIIGIPTAVLLTWKGRLGLAGLAASPYWLPYYLLFVLLELRRSGTSASGRDRGARPVVDHRVAAFGERAAQHRAAVGRGEESQARALGKVEIVEVKSQLRQAA